MNAQMYAGLMVAMAGTEYLVERLRKSRPGGIVRVRDIRHVPLPLMPATSHANKCPGCGSHEFRRHQGVRVCAYCRTAESGCEEAPFIAGQGQTP